jgi:hypothetical protein
MQPLLLPPPATEPPRPPSTVDSPPPCHHTLLPSCCHLSPPPRSRCAAVIFGRCSVAVGAASCGSRLRMALCSGRLRAALHSVTQPLSSCSVVWRHLRVAWGCCRVAIVFTCRRTAIVFASLLLSGLCRLRHHGHHHCLVAEGQRHIPSDAPANGGGCAGARGNGHAPASA